MKGEQHYNDTAFDYFILFVLAAITLPATYVFIKRRLAPPRDDALRCACSACAQRDRAESEKVKKGPSVGSIAKGAVLVVLWALLVMVLINVSTKQEAPAAGYFDPYAILGLEPGAPMEEIKRTYKKLSLIHHPDKAPDPTDPEVQKRYINLVKAYETLTDELIRANWEKYGNPDGPQAMSVGIALPSWLVKEDNTFVVLGVYLSLLVIGLPAVVCCWWRSWKKYDNQSKVMNSTMGLYYHGIEPNFKMRSLVEFLGASQEYQQIPQRPTDDKLEKIAKRIPENHSPLKKKPKFNAPYAVKSYILLYAQICRLQNDLKGTHQQDLDFLLSKMRPLIGGMITICTAKGFYFPIVECIQLMQQLTQSAWKDNSLLQLPHFVEYMITDAGTRKFNAPDILSFSALSPEKRSEFYAKENLTSEQSKDIEAVLDFLPTKVGFEFSYEVEGEDNADRIVCGAIVTFSYTITRDPKAKAKADSDEKSEKSEKSEKGEKSEKSEKEERDRHREKREKSREGEKFVFGKPKKPKSEDEKQKRIVHAPFFPERRDECWWVVIGDLRGNGGLGSLVGISKVGSVDDVVEGMLKFQAPKTEGNYTFSGWLMCDGYLGLDRKFEFRIRVVRDEVAEKEKAAALERMKKKEQAKKLKEVNDKGEEIEEDSDDDFDDDESSDDEDVGSE